MTTPHTTPALEALAVPVPLRLKPSRQFPFLARHPWVQVHALAERGDDLTAGQVVDVLDHDGNFVARGLINPASRLRVRLYAFDASTGLGDLFWQRRIDAAISRRRNLNLNAPDSAERLVFSESDLISGLIVDRYADALSVHFTAGGLYAFRAGILDHLARVLEPRSILVRVDERTAKHEGIAEADFWTHGEPIGEPIAYRQNGLDLALDLAGGQKTGGYLDQRVNHQVAADYLRGRNRVLDVCCYTGGFGLVAANNGAQSVIGVDSSEPALQAAAANAQRNGLSNMSFVKSDCFDDLKRRGEAGEKFDAIILDPPKFAGSRKQVDSAIRAYARLNSLAVDLIEPGGILVTCSCSGRVARSDFLNMLLDVGRRRRRDLVVMETRGPAPDHPVAAACPESDYLKCVIAEVR